MDPSQFLGHPITVGVLEVRDGNTVELIPSAVVVCPRCNMIAYAALCGNDLGTFLVGIDVHASNCK